jgi:serine/threonine protein phosphatase PrpC
MRQGTGFRNEDMAELIEHPRGALLVVADGAGGIPGGKEAAEMVVRLMREEAPQPRDFLDAGFWQKALRSMDLAIWDDAAAGQTTAVVVAVTPTRLAGAGVGDSRALLIGPDGCLELTRNQHRRPFLGTGAAVPVPFRRDVSGGRLLVATDGIFNYAGRETICALAREGDLAGAADALVEAVSLPNGALMDDVGLILCDLDGDRA